MPKLYANVPRERLSMSITLLMGGEKDGKISFSFYRQDGNQEFIADLSSVIWEKFQYTIADRNKFSVDEVKVANRAVLPV